MGISRDNINLGVVYNVNVYVNVIRAQARVEDYGNHNSLLERHDVG